ncbi:hypothetical protein EXIGLDRAFT_718652, partial [Exidia glandulosa HHB12029]
MPPPSTLSNNLNTPTVPRSLSHIARRIRAARAVRSRTSILDDESAMNLDLLFPDIHDAHDVTPTASKVVARPSTVRERRRAIARAPSIEGDFNLGMLFPTPTQAGRSDKPKPRTRKKQNRMNFSVGRIRHGKIQRANASHSVRGTRTPIAHTSGHHGGSVLETAPSLRPRRSSLESAAMTSDVRWQSPLSPGEGALYGALGVVSATVQAPQPQTAAQSYAATVMARRERASAGSVPVATTQDTAEKLQKVSIHTGAPLLPPIQLQHSINFADASRTSLFRTFSQPVSDMPDQSSHRRRQRHASLDDLQSTYSN